MAYVVVHQQGGALITNSKPIRESVVDINGKTIGVWGLKPCGVDRQYVWITKKCACRITGKLLTWEDEPVELK